MSEPFFQLSSDFHAISSKMLVKQLKSKNTIVLQINPRFWKKLSLRKINLLNRPWIATLFCLKGVSLELSSGKDDVLFGTRPTRSTVASG